MPQNYNACSPGATPPTFSANNTNLGQPQLSYPIRFPYIAATDIVVFTGDTGNWTLRNQGTGANEYAVNPQTGQGTDQVVFVGGTPGNRIMITRRTDLCAAARVFQAGASIRAQDLNTDMNQLRFLIQELNSWLEMFVGNEGDELIPGEGPDLGDLGNVDLTGAVNRSYLAFDGTDWEDARVWRSTENMLINDTDIATTAANDARYLAAGGGNLFGGAGIDRTAAGGNVTISVDIHGTDPGLELDPAGNGGQLRVLGNAVTNTANPDLTNGPSTVNIDGGAGITIQGSGGNTITISSQTGAGGLTFRGTVNPSVQPSTVANNPFLNASLGDAWTVDTQCNQPGGIAPVVQAEWVTLLENYTNNGGVIGVGDIFACNSNDNRGGTVAERANDFSRIPTGGGFGTLQQVTNNGATTTRSITLEDGANLVLQNGAQNQTISINADDAAATYNLTLPPTRGTANQLLGINTADAGGNIELEWTSAGGGATGGANGANQDYIFQENGQTVRTNYTVGTTLAAQPGSGATTNTTNALSAGPVTINNGVTVTIENGSNWVVI